MNRQLFKRIAKRVRIGKGFDCWEWTGYRFKSNYGGVSVGSRSTRKMLYVHRLMYEKLFGPIKNNLHLDHRCVNPVCCRPFHLEAVTSKTNSLRAVSIWFCKKGHVLLKENIFKRKNNTITCRTCKQINERERYRKK